MEDDLATAPQFWRREVEDKVLNKTNDRRNQKAMSNRAIRWYPPLLTLSTLMSGIFCWLYVTKPVHVTQTVISSGVGSDVAGLPVLSSLEDEGQASAAGKGSAFSGLDPERAGLPGDPIPVAESKATVLPGQEFAPLVVPRPTEPVFQPMSPEELSEALQASAGEGAMEIAPAGTLGPPPSEIPSTPEGEAVAVPLEEPEMLEEADSYKETEEGAFGPVEEGLYGGVRFDLQKDSPATERGIAVSIMGELVSEYVESEAGLADSKKE